MASRKIRNSWWIDFRFDHVRYRKKSPENSKSGSEAYEATLRHRLARGQSLKNENKKRKQLFKEFAWSWFDTYVRANNKASVISMKTYILRGHLVPFFGNIPLEEISTLDIEKYKARKLDDGFQPQTVNYHLNVFSSCFRSAQEWQLLDKIPTIKFLNVAPYQSDFLSIGESEKLLLHAKGIWREIIFVALRTGLRRGELRALDWQDINWDTQTLSVRRSWCDFKNGFVTPKSNKQRYIPLNNEVACVLSERRKMSGLIFSDQNGHRLTARRIGREIRKACRKAGIREITCHTLRHTFASHLVMKGAPLRAVQELMGHANIQTTMRYSHLTTSSLKASIALLETSITPLQNLGNIWSISEISSPQHGVSDETFMA